MLKILHHEILCKQALRLSDDWAYRNLSQNGIAQGLTWLVIYYSNTGTSK